MRVIFLTLFFFAFLDQGMFSQSQYSKWYFGNRAGLDFMNSPPTVLTGSMNTAEGCSSIADASGNLLFYTDGIKVFNQQHQVMANGTGLTGSIDASQSALIVKVPGSASIYYIFTVDKVAFPNGLRYSTVDMAIAAGMGSVTVKNTLLVTPTTEKLCAARHCNGVDVWVLSHDYPGNTYRAYLVTSAGVSNTPVLSVTGTYMDTIAATQGCMKFSPTGKKLGVCTANSAGSPVFELFDFDNSTGIISNPIQLPIRGYIYDCAFSPDGTKLYGSTIPDIHQWDLCASSSVAVIATLHTFTSAIPLGMQVGLDGKIYVSQTTSIAPFLGIINNPNAAGTACNYVNNGMSVSPNFASAGLPNFVSEKIPPPPFTYNINTFAGCTTASFAINSGTCAATSTNFTSLLWHFGDPSSGASNTATSRNPIHNYPGPGTYTTELIFYYPCGTDTLRQQVIIGQTILPVPSMTICKGQAAILTASGNVTYTWNTGGSTASINVSPMLTTTYSVSGTTSNGCFNSGTVNVTVNALPTLSISGTTVICEGEGILFGASGANSFTWSNGTIGSVLNLTSTSAVDFTVYGTNSFGCVGEKIIALNVNPNPTLTITGATTVCPGSSVALSVNGAVNYTWSNGATTLSTSVPGNYLYSVDGKDANGCSATASVFISFVTTPAVTEFSFLPACEKNASIQSPIKATKFTAGGIFSSPGIYIHAITGEIVLNSLTAGTYSIDYFVPANGCIASGNYTSEFKVLPVAALNLISELNISPGASTVLHVSGGLSYTWSPAQNLSCVNCDNPVADPSENKTYCVSSILGSCESKACVLISVSCEGNLDLSLPNAFTPNGDGNNDELCLQGWSYCVENFNIMIYDRWGEQIFASTNPSFCWDGTYKGKLQNTDVFVYVLSAIFNKTKEVRKKGTIHLIR